MWQENKLFFFLFFFFFRWWFLWKCVCGWTALFADWSSDVVNVEEPALLCLGMFRESLAVHSCCSWQCYLFWQCFFLMSWMFFCWFLSVKPCDVQKTSVYWLKACSISHYFLYEAVCAWTDFNHIFCHLKLTFMLLYSSCSEPGSEDSGSHKLAFII